MRIIRINEAEASFSALVSAVEAGEELALSRHGRIVARMLPGIQQTDAASCRRGRAESDLLAASRFSIETGLISPLD